DVCSSDLVSRSDYNCVMTRRLVTLSFALLLLGCGKVEEQKLLPWFRIRTSHAREAGIISFGSNKTEYFVKSGWSWKKLNVYGGAAVPMNPETVFFYSNGQAQIIHRGETKWRPACGSSFAFATIAHKAQAVDCVETLEGPLGVPKKIRWRRFTERGALVNDQTLEVES